jgi:hypothetical protein
MKVGHFILGALLSWGARKHDENRVGMVTAAAMEGGFGYQMICLGIRANVAHEVNLKP